MPAPLDAVFLDAGGVLVCPDSTRIAERFAADGLTIDPSAVVAAHYHGVHAIDTNEAEPEEFSHYHHAFARHLGFRGDDHRAAVAALEGLWEQSGLWTQSLPWAAAGLAAIADAGLPIVIVSNADGTVRQVLESTGLLHLGPGPAVEVLAIIDSGEVGVAKPDARIFDHALAAVGTTADRVVHVGDAYQYDVRGARAAGIRPVLVDPLGLRPAVDCDRIGSLTELLALLG